ncbi:MAG: ComEC/Rec2 family competence protein [Prevotella sp.]|nr:ComEC/Rec2 family competence protein [Prevotella sp.]
MAPLLPVAASLIAGIAAGRYWAEASLYGLPLLVVALVLTALAHRLPRWQTAGIYVSTLLLGYCLSAHEVQWPKPATLRQARHNMLQFRTTLTSQYEAAGLDGEAYAIVAAMTLGDKSALTTDMRHSYNTTGAAHVLALSGLHLSIIYWFITLLTAGRRRHWLIQAVTILTVWAFAFLTGLAPSIVRAATMLTVYALMNIGYRRGASVNVLAFTAIVTLLLTPSAVFDIGFQLSYLAVLGILLFYPHLYGLIPADFLQRHRLVRTLWAMVVVSCAAQIAVAPVIAFYFHRFSPYFLLANIVVIPEAYLILTGGVVLLFSGSALVASALTATALTAGNLLTVIARLPGASISPLHPTLAQTLLLYVVIGSLYVVVTRFRPE